MAILPYYYTLYTSLCLIISKIVQAKSPLSSLSPLYYSDNVVHGLVTYTATRFIDEQKCPFDLVLLSIQCRSEEDEEDSVYSNYEEKKLYTYKEGVGDKEGGGGYKGSTGNRNSVSRRVISN